MNFAAEIKALETEVNRGCEENDKVSLYLVILADTVEGDLMYSKSAYEEKGVIFMQAGYMETLFKAILPPSLR